MPHLEHHPRETFWGAFLARHGERFAVPGDAADTDLLRYLDATGQRVQISRRLLALGGKDLDGSDVLVIGSPDAAEVVWCAGIGAASVVATEWPDDPASPNDPARRIRDHLIDLAISRARELDFHTPPERARIRFVADDIAASSLPSASYDVIMSWHALEHVDDLTGAVREMARLLRPRGAMVHEYTPFFSIDGDGSSGRPALPWEHVRRDAADRTDERPAPAPRTHHRLTQRQVRTVFEDAGLVLEAWLPHPRTEDLLQLSPELLEACRRGHPDVEVVDLVSRVVRLVARKPV